MSDKKKDWRSKPDHIRKVKYISMRVSNPDYKRIMALFGDNIGVREFLVQYAKDHQGEKL